MNDFFSSIEHALLLQNPQNKLKAVNRIYVDCKQNSKLTLDHIYPVKPMLVPGRPEKPALVVPKNLKQRKLTTVLGRASMAHAIAHIEFNAINLALDACYRFRNLPEKFYLDWLRVAFEEAKHFELLNQYLHNLGYQYGDFPAHNSLWELATETAYSPLARMGLVPRIMEARGLDVSPGIIKKFQSINDHDMVGILEIIFQEEIGHVTIGNYWFNFLCKQENLDPMTAFKSLVKKHVKGQIREPILDEVRRKAGFTDEELSWLHGYIEK